MFKVYFTALLLFVAWAHAADPIIIPLTHNSAEAKRLEILNVDLASVENVPKYSRRGNVEDLLTQGTTSVIITCQINMGVSRTPFTVLVDTGSPLLALPTPGCQCDTDAPHAPYDSPNNALKCTDSRCKSCCDGISCPDRSLCSFGLQYSDGTGLNGTVYEDIIEIGGLKTQTMFGGITQESPGFVAPYADGIMGFSQDGSISCVPSCISPVFSMLVNQKLVQNSFGIYLGFDNTGELSLGQPDMGLVDGTFSYTPLQTSSNHYEIALNSLQIASTPVVNNINAILDTGTTYMLLPRPSYELLVNYFKQNYCDLTGVCSTVNIFNGNCLLDHDKVLQFPTLQFQFDGVEVSIEPATYFLTTSRKGQYAYCFGIAAWNDDFAVLGYTFMHGYYIYYDMENHRVGFAGAANTTKALSLKNSAVNFTPSYLLLISLICTVFIVVNYL